MRALKFLIVFFCLLPLNCLCQKKHFLSGDFILIRIKNVLSQDCIINNEVIVFLDSNIAKYNKQELICDFLKNKKLFYNEILHYPRIYIDDANFYWTKSNNKFKIDKDFYNYSSETIFSPDINLNIGIKTHCCGYSYEIYIKYNIIFFTAKQNFISHNTNKDAYGCNLLCIDKNDNLYFSESDKEPLVFYPIISK